VGPPQYLCSCHDDQGPRRRFPARRCLLKGCEQSFQPRQPQSRYCSAACQQAARRWRRRHASQRYRASKQGKERRRAQSRRYRQRQPTATLTANAVKAAPAATAAPREGQRPAHFGKDFRWRRCQRPGCYVWFRVPSRSPGQHFCSCLCRQALRRVLDREAHWRRRHRRPQARRRPPSRPPPNSS